MSMDNEAREVVERLRSLGENPSFIELLDAVTGSHPCNYGVARYHLIELIEHGSTPDVDVAALLELAGKMRIDADNCVSVSGAVLKSYADSIRKAVEGAPKPGTSCEGETHAQDDNSCVGECGLCERNGMVEWVEEPGGLEAVQERIDSFARMLNSVDSIVCGDEQHCFDARIDLGEANELFGVIYGELDKRLMPLDMDDTSSLADEYRSKCREFSDLANLVATTAGIKANDEEAPEPVIWRAIDEIRKRLMPPGMEWPRFEDGWKVACGDEFRVYGETRVRKTYGISTYKDGSFIIHFNPICGHRFAPGERVKRPEPEVLGADGEPIRKGETMYSIHDGKCATVKSLFGNIGLQMESDDGDCFETAPLNLTHERPVFGADGLPIKVGEAVNNDYSTRTVSEVHASANPYGDDFPWVRYTDGEWDLASNVTHTPPDTQERINEDALKGVSRYWGCQHLTYCDTCPSKIDGENPRERYSVGFCADAKTLDLLRRQRVLDAKTTGGAQ